MNPHGRPPAPPFKLPKNVTSTLVTENKALHDRCSHLATEVAALRPVFDAAAAGDQSRLQDTIAKASNYLGAPIQSNLAPEEYRRMIIFYIDWARQCHAPMAPIYRFFNTDPQQVRDWKQRLERGRPVRMRPGQKAFTDEDLFASTKIELDDVESTDTPVKEAPQVQSKETPTPSSLDDLLFGL